MRARIFATLILLALTGCALKKPIRAMYCVEKRADGSCQTWASPIPNQECKPTEVSMVCQ